MIGALAVACFVKVFGTVFLGNPRTSLTSGAVEQSWFMLAPMTVLAAACVFIGIIPGALTPVLDVTISAFGQAFSQTAVSTGTAAPLATLGSVSLVLILLVSALAVSSFFFIRVRRQSGTWDCGYAAPTGRMQYTASSFARTIVDLFGWITRPVVHGKKVENLFPEKAGVESHVNEAVLDRVLRPASAAWK